MTLVIAVDGTASSGKGTLCKELARRHSWLCVESGLFYRSLGRAMQNNASSELIQTHTFDDLADGELRSEETAKQASNIAKNPDVRARINSVLRSLAQHLPSVYKGLIIDGRDIGTVVFPDAPVKFFLTASEEVRIQRREKELGIPADQLTERDKQDSTRKHAPLHAAEDAYVIDTSDLDPEGVRLEAEQYIQKILPGK